MHPLDGAREHLKRAKENIRYLEGELSRFLASAPSVTLAVDPNKRHTAFYFTDPHKLAVQVTIDVAREVRRIEE